jgi:uncharacterized protein (DUF2252 family)
MVEPTPIPTAAAQASIDEAKQRRAAVPRRLLGELAPRMADYDPVATLERQSAARIQSLVPLRYDRMAQSEFTFLRGAAATMAHDLGSAPTTGLTVQLCGDAHFMNFGMYLSPERHLVFDVNDFDETLPGPFEWDAKRLVASCAVAGQVWNFSQFDIEKIVLAAASQYRTAMARFAGMSNLDMWYQRYDVKEHIDDLRLMFNRGGKTPVDDLIAKAEKKNSKRAASKLTEFDDAGIRRFRNEPPVIVPLTKLLQEPYASWTLPQAIRTVMANYSDGLETDRRFFLNTMTATDIARKVVGVGSVGTRCYVVLLEGNYIGEPLILQAKEAVPSVLEAHLGPSQYPTSGARVVAGQRLMQATPDIFLGHYQMEFNPGEVYDFYMRQLHDGKASPAFDIDVDERPVRHYAELCALTLARAHARSGNRAAIAAYLGSSDSFDRAMVAWALSAVERNRDDYKKFMEAIDSGRLPRSPEGTVSSPAT